MINWNFSKFNFIFYILSLFITYMEISNCINCNHKTSFLLNSIILFVCIFIEFNKKTIDDEIIPSYKNPPPPPPFIKKLG